MCNLQHIFDFQWQVSYNQLDPLSHQPIYINPYDYVAEEQESLVGQWLGQGSSVDTIN